MIKHFGPEYLQPILHFADVLVLQPIFWVLLSALSTDHPVKIEPSEFIPKRRFVKWIHSLVSKNGLN